MKTIPSVQSSVHSKVVNIAQLLQGVFKKKNYYFKDYLAALFSTIYFISFIL